jgi:oligopeptide/dipeptide ABC transporter ATP-binding protein
MLLQVDDLRTEFAPRRGVAVHAVRGVDFAIDKGEMLGIVGESGCGKSVTAMSLVGLIDRPGRVTAGRIVFDGLDLAAVGEARLRGIRGKRIAFIFQDPMTALNPVLTIGTQLVETIRAHDSVSARNAARIAREWLARVRIPNPDQRLRQYPHELSGGMRQRVMIAMAFCLRPELLIADEPTTALDVTVQARILDLMDDMRRDSETAVLLITHDLGIVAERCDRVAVMYAGEIVESASVDDLFASPKHPYTQALLASLPDINRRAQDGPLAYLEGRPPHMSADRLPAGCPFAPRCASVMDVCRSHAPIARHLGGGTVKCHLYEERHEEG